MECNLTTVRETLMQAMQRLTDKNNPIDIATAKTTAQLASVLIDSASVEVEYIRATGGDGSQFMEASQSTHAIRQHRIPASATSGEPTAHNPFPRLRGD